jgi:deoxyribonuclease-4
MWLGFHMPISGGLDLAVARGLRVGCEAIQIFSRNPRAWQSRPLTDAAAECFRRARAEAGLRIVAVHLPYLPNLAADQGDLREKSMASLAEEMLRADRLGAEFVVAHPGHAPANEPRKKACQRVGKNTARALKALGRPGRARLLLENMSGQHGELGGAMEELAWMIEALEAASRGRFTADICLDTAHAWGAGYDLARPKGQEALLAEIDRWLGLERLALVHLNDSKVELGSRRDRHAAPGQGRIGSRGLARFIRHPGLMHLAGLMEPPGMTEENDLRQMILMKRWRRAPRSAAARCS